MQAHGQRPTCSSAASVTLVCARFNCTRWAQTGQCAMPASSTSVFDRFTLRQTASSGQRAPHRRSVIIVPSSDSICSRGQRARCASSLVADRQIGQVENLEAADEFKLGQAGIGHLALADIQSAQPRHACADRSARVADLREFEPQGFEQLQSLAGATVPRW